MPVTHRAICRTFLVPILLAFLAPSAEAQSAITINATALADQTIQIYKVGDATPIDTFLTTDTPRQVNLEPQPAVYTFRAGHAWPKFNFWVTSTAVLDYDGSFDSFVAGRNGTTLTVSGYTVTIDATALTPQTTKIEGIGPFPQHTASSIGPLLPGPYEFQGAGWVRFWFEVARDGKIDFGPPSVQVSTVLSDGQVNGTGLEAFLSGRDTTTLTVNGFNITIDATALTPQTTTLLHISGRGASRVAGTALSGLRHHLVRSAGRPAPGDLTSPGYVDFQQDTVTKFGPLLPGVYEFRTGAATRFWFEVTGDGKIDYGSQLTPASSELRDGIVNGTGLDGFLLGRGFSTLMVRGFDITVDVRGLYDLATPLTVFRVPGVTPSFSTGAVQTLTVIPGRYPFRSFQNATLGAIGGSASTASEPAFTIADDGEVVVLPNPSAPGGADNGGNPHAGEAFLGSMRQLKIAQAPVPPPPPPPWIHLNLILLVALAILFLVFWCCCRRGARD